jgi:exodeoxyribonuclease VII small subunit
MREYCPADRKRNNCSMKQGKKIEEYMEELQTVADRLNDPDVSLDEAVSLYKNGMEAATKAQELLNAYRQEIEMLNHTFANEGGAQDE